MQYSLLLAGDAVRKYTVDTVEEYISQGIKCILFIPRRDAVDWIRLKERYSIQNFQLYTVDAGNIPSLEIYDGHLGEPDDVAGSHGEGWNEILTHCVGSLCLRPLILNSTVWNTPIQPI